MNKNEPSTSRIQSSEAGSAEEHTIHLMPEETEGDIIVEVTAEEVVESSCVRPAVAQPQSGASSSQSTSALKRPFAYTSNVDSRSKAKPISSFATSNELVVKRRRVAGSIIGAGVNVRQSNVTEIARRSGRPTVLHSSGVEFPIPLSLESHPIPLSDVIPEAAHDILKDDEALPYCSACHSVLKSWRAFEYHVFSKHLKYKPHRCLYCMKEYFHTEDEGISHVKSMHPTKPITLLKEYDEKKENEAHEYFDRLFMMVREGENLTREKMQEIERSAFNHLQRYHRMRFKVPTIVCRQGMTRDASSQTHLSTVNPSNSYTPTFKYQPASRVNSSPYVLNRNPMYLMREESVGVVGNEMLLESSAEITDDAQHMQSNY